MGFDGDEARKAGSEGSSISSKASVGRVLVHDPWSKLRFKISWTATRLGLPNASGTLVFYLDRPTCRMACNWRSRGFQSWACHSQGRSPAASRLVLSQSRIDRVSVHYGQYAQTCFPYDLMDIKVGPVFSSATRPLGEHSWSNTHRPSTSEPFTQPGQ